MNSFIHNSNKAIQRWGLLAAMGLASVSASAQAINESFDDITTLAAAGWATQNLSTPIGTVTDWFQGDATVFPQFSGTGYIGANYNMVAGAATISAWLMTPNRTFNNGDVITFYTSTTAGSQWADNLQLRLSTAGTSTNVGTTNTSVGDFTTLLLEVNPTMVAANYPATWTQYSVTLSGLAGPTSGRLAFRYFVPDGGPNGSNSNYIGVDQFAYTPAGAGAPDMTINKVNGEYTEIPLAQVTSMALGGTVQNAGTSGATNAVLTAKVFMAPNFTTPVQTTTSVSTAVNTGATANLTCGNYTPSAVGTYVYQYIISASGDNNATNDTLEYIFAVTNDEYARDNGNVVSVIGIGGGAAGKIGSMYQINASTTIDSVFFALSKYGSSNAIGDAIGDTTRIEIYSVAGGLPSTLLGFSNKYIFTAADTAVNGSITTYTFKINAAGGGNLTLAPGTYYVAVAEYNTNVGLCFANGIVTPNTVFAGWTGQPYTPVEAFGSSFALTPVLRPIFQYCTMTASASATDASCGVADGTATVTPANGVAPFTYAWTGGQTTATATGLTAGQYTVTVTASNGCTATASTTVNLSNGPNPTGTVTNVSCNGGNDGMVDVMVVGGTAPYFFNWTNGATTEDATGLVAGSYSVTVTDNNGCAIPFTFTVTEPTALTASMNVTDATCFGNTDGAVDLSVSGGTAPYSYEWNTSATTEDLSGVAAGNYDVRITDNNGCELVETVVVAEPAELMVTLTGVDETNNDDNGSVSTTVTGGTAPYSYDWNTNATTANISGLAAGGYVVTVTDANGCMVVSDSIILDNIVSVQDIELAQNINLFPNPTSDVVTLTFSLSQVADVQVEVLTVTGQVIEQFNQVAVQQNQFVIDTRRYAAGMYFVRVRANEAVATLKLIRE